MTSTDPDELTVLQRLRFYLFEPWWRALWFIGAIVWGIGLNIAYIATGGEIEILGILSIVPIFAFVIEGQSRARKIRQAKVNKTRL
jgi:hypothetical protein